MGKKKRGHPDVEEVLARPWCYYCERDFDDLKILISHQKAKHFKCERCGRRLNTAGGLSVHLNQVHKETLTNVENALPNRSNLDVEIFGMEGIPEDVLQAHNQRVVGQLQQAETERRAATGNPPPGTGSGTKKPKFESPSEMKKRLAEHKARLAEQNAGGNSGGATPNGFSQRPSSPGIGQSAGPGQGPGPYAESPSYPISAQPYSGPPPNNFPPYPQSYGPYSPSISQGYPSSNVPAYASQGSQFPPAHQQHPAPFQSHQSIPPNPYGAHPAPGGSASLPPRLESLPPPPGLPQRPSFGAPPVNNHQLQQMHHAPSHLVENQSASLDSNVPRTQTHESDDAITLDELVSGAASAAAKLNVNPPNQGDKKAKKEKSTKLMYSDNEVSPEEKMAGLPRYAFVPDRKGESVLGNAVQATVTGVVQD